MEKQPTQQPVVRFNVSEFNGWVNEAKTFAALAQKMLNLHIENGNYFALDSVSYFEEIARNGENWYKAKIIEKTQPLKLSSGFTIKQRAMADLIDFPDLSWAWFAKDLAFSLQKGGDLCVIKGDKVLVDEEKVSQLKERCTYRAKTNIEEQILQAHAAAAEALNELQVILKKAGSLIHGEMELRSLFFFREKIERHEGITVDFCINSNRQSQ